MSAFVVADKTINRVVSFLMNPEDNLEIDSPLDEYLSPSGIKCAAVKLGQAMRDLNVASVSHRYGDDPDMLPKQPFAFVEEPTDRIQAFKSLGCWLYQCSEGEFDKDPLFKRLGKLRTDIAMDVVCDSKAYAKAQWG